MLFYEAINARADYVGCARVKADKTWDTCRSCGGHMTCPLFAGYNALNDDVELARDDLRASMEGV
jgi:hypothetical protein